MTIPPRARTRDYFVAGGTLRADAPSYVERPADEELFELILAGQFAYVLTTRQLGKSSLMTRTAHRLKKDGLSTATIDLTSLGMALEERWYLGLLGELTRQLHLEIDPEAWWQERSWLPTVQRFIGFLRDVVLSEIQEQVVIFIDEIDSTLRLDFSDDFFAGIRAVYNTRAQEPIFERLTFVLLGVASPPDLIKERTRTPFNIGQGVLLQDFNRNDTVPLQIGLEKEYPDQSEAIFTRIYHWTDGHPYLTQKLCKEVVKGEEERWTNEQIDELVERTFLSDKALKEENLQFVRDKILTHAKQRQLLALYRKVHEGQKVADDAQSPLQTQLKLSGLVKTENGHLGVRNKIYKSIFDMTWVRENTKTNWSPIIAAIFALVATLAIGYNVYNSWIANRVELSIAKFYQTSYREERVTRLAQIFQMQGAFGAADYDHKARELFYSLSRNEQLALFEADKAANSDMISLVQGLYTTLADVDGSDRTRPLLEIMVRALNKLDETQQTTNLQDEINSWLQGRAFYRQNLYTEARAHYEEALSLNGQNPATLYEKARVLTELSRYEEALADLDSIVAIANRTLVPTTPTPPLETSLPTSTPTSAATPSITLTPKTSSVTPADLSPATTADTLPAFTSEFDTSEKMIGAVRNFIQSHPELADALTAASDQYTNLLVLGLVSTTAPLPQPTNSPPPTGLPTETPSLTVTRAETPSSAVTLLPMPTNTPSPPALITYQEAPQPTSPINEAVKSENVTFTWKWNGGELAPGHLFAIQGFRDGQWLRLGTFDGATRSGEIYMPAFGNFETLWEWYMVVIDESGVHQGTRSKTQRFAISLMEPPPIGTVPLIPAPINTLSPTSIPFSAPTEIIVPPNLSQISLISPPNKEGFNQGSTIRFHWSWNGNLARNAAPTYRLSILKFGNVERSFDTSGSSYTWQSDLVPEGYDWNVVVLNGGVPIEQTRSWNYKLYISGGGGDNGGGDNPPPATIPP